MLSLLRTFKSLEAQRNTGESFKRIAVVIAESVDAAVQCATSLQQVPNTERDLKIEISACPKIDSGMSPLESWQDLMQKDVLVTTEEVRHHSQYIYAHPSFSIC